MIDDVLIKKSIILTQIIVIICVNLLRKLLKTLIEIEKMRFDFIEPFIKYG